MSYIFEEWEERLANFENSVDKKLEEIRKCKAEMQQMKLDLIAEIKKGRYVRDTERLVLSAPEIVIGNVDRNGALLGGGSTVIIRGTQVGVQGSGEGGQVELRAASIREIAEDPGVDGYEHVVGPLSEIVSQARNIIIQSDDAEGTFSTPTIPTGGSGVRIHADKNIDIHAAMTAESREERLEELIESMEELQSNLKDQAANCKESFDSLASELQGLIKERDDLSGDNEDVRTNYNDIREKSEEIETATQSLTQQTYAYVNVLSQLAETSRRLQCFKDEKAKIKKGDDFKNNPTGAKVRITGENISLASADGENNLRDNEGAGITMIANEVGIASIEDDGTLKEKGKVNILAKNIEVSTANTADTEVDDEGNLTKATYAAEGDFILKSKNVTIEGVDYEIAESQLKEKGLTDDSKIKVRAKTIEVSTESSANIEADEEGNTIKADYTAEGDFIIKSKTFSVVSTDAEGKAIGSISLNAKAVNVKSMDTDKESGADSALAEGSTMLLVAEKMFVGAKSKDVKSKKVQTMSEEVGLFADNTLEAQQGDGKAMMQLDGGNAAIGGQQTQIYGDMTINAKTDIKGDLTAPKAAIGDIQAKSHFKSPNIEDGMAAGAGGGGGNLSAKIQAEDAPEEGI